MIFVGDATMSPYEITYPGGSVEHANPEPGALWMQRMLAVYKMDLAQPRSPKKSGIITSRFD